ncbi:MAG: monovalent cation/H+ antiporter complex subunit F [Pseudomonadota bacterium]
MGDAMLTIAIYTTLAVLLIAFAVTVWRLIAGPRLADRIVALDMLALLGLGFIGAIALLTEEDAYIDVAIGLALVGFLATVAFARYVYFREFIAQEGAKDDE